MVFRGRHVRIDEKYRASSVVKLETVIGTPARVTSIEASAMHPPAESILDSGGEALSSSIFYNRADILQRLRDKNYALECRPRICLQHSVHEDCTVISYPHIQGIVFDSEFRAIKGTMEIAKIFPENPFLNHTPAGWQLISELEPHVEFEEAVIVCDSGANNIAHIVCFTLPTVVAARELGLTAPVLLMDCREQDSSTHLCELMLSFAGIKRDTISIVPRGMIVKIRRCHLVKTDRRQMLPFASVVQDTYKKIAGAAQKQSGDFTIGGDLFISRAKATCRRIINEEADLLPLLGEYGFRRIFLEDLPLDQQIAAFASAERIIAPHGAGLAHLAFASQGARVLEIFSNQDFRPLFFNLAMASGIEYGAALFPPVNEISDVELPPNSLRQLLDALCCLRVTASSQAVELISPCWRKNWWTREDRVKLNSTGGIPPFRLPSSQPAMRRWALSFSLPLIRCYPRLGQFPVIEKLPPRLSPGREQRIER